MNNLEASRLLVVDLPTCRIGIMFKHVIYTTPLYELQTCDRFLNGITHCEIYIEVIVGGEKAWTICTVGRGLCKLPDQYRKDVGRKKALTSALRKHASRRKLFGYSERAMIWQAYWDWLSPVKAKAEPISAEVLVPHLSPIKPIHVAGTQLDISGNLMGEM
jgi:hypothetical protein